MSAEVSDLFIQMRQSLFELLPVPGVTRRLKIVKDACAR